MSGRDDLAADAARRHPSRPVVGVGVVVLRGEAVLLVRRAQPPRQGEWSLPGGAQELGETVREAALRELGEETGVAATLGELLEVVDLVARDAAGRIERHYTLIDFAARWTAGEPRPGGDAAEARFVPLAELDSLDLWAETLRVIRLATERI